MHSRNGSEFGADRGLRAFESCAALSLSGFERAAQIVVGTGRLRGDSLPPRSRRARNSGQAPVAVVVCGAGSDLCGAFNERLAESAIAALSLREVPPNERVVLAVGEGVAAALESLGQPVEQTVAPPGSTATLAGRARRIARTLADWSALHGVRRVLLAHARRAPGGFRPRLQALPAPFRSRYVSSGAVDGGHSRRLPRLVHRHVHASIYAALAETGAAENASCISRIRGLERNAG